MLSPTSTVNILVPSVILMPFAAKPLPFPAALKNDRLNEPRLPPPLPDTLTLLPSVMPPPNCVEPIASPPATILPIDVMLKVPAPVPRNTIPVLLLGPICTVLTPALIAPPMLKLPGPPDRIDTSPREELIVETVARLNAPPMPVVSWTAAPGNGCVFERFVPLTLTLVLMVMSASEPVPVVVSTSPPAVIVFALVGLLPMLIDLLDVIASVPATDDAPNTTGLLPPRSAPGPLVVRTVSATGLPGLAMLFCTPSAFPPNVPMPFAATRLMVGANIAAPDPVVVMEPLFTVRLTWVAASTLVSGGTTRLPLCVMNTLPLGALASSVADALAGDPATRLVNIGRLAVPMLPVPAVRFNTLPLLTNSVLPDVVWLIEPAAFRVRFAPAAPVVVTVAPLLSRMLPEPVAVTANPTAPAADDLPCKFTLTGEATPTLPPALAVSVTVPVALVTVTTEPSSMLPPAVSTMFGALKVGFAGDEV